MTQGGCDRFHDDHLGRPRILAGSTRRLRLRGRLLTMSVRQPDQAKERQIRHDADCPQDPLHAPATLLHGRRPSGLDEKVVLRRILRDTLHLPDWEIDDLLVEMSILVDVARGPSGRQRLETPLDVRDAMAGAVADGDDVNPATDRASSLQALRHYFTAVTDLMYSTSFLSNTDPSGRKMS